jgi:ABC-type dipeptide/oligopeptide/nickel transport system permease component
MLHKYIAKRIGIGLLQLLGLAIAVFFLIRVMPADPASRLVGMNASDEAYAAARHQLGLDRPLVEQLGAYLGIGTDTSGLLQGDLGVSWITSSPITQEIATYLPVTLELVTLSFAVALLISVPVGMAAALKPGGRVDKAVFYYGLFAGSQPEFWWGLLFVYVFFFQLGIAPAPLGSLSPMTLPPDRITGFITIDSLLAGRPEVFLEALQHLVLPIVTLTFILSGPVIKMVRQNMAKALQSDFVLYANCAGLPAGRIARYALRAALAPSLTLIGILYGFMLGGAVLVETVFTLPGLGQYAIRSVLELDYPAIQGVVIVITALSLLVYLALDLVHAVIDPRISH